MRFGHSGWAALLVMVSLATGGNAQESTPRSPELQVLDAWTGHWTTHGKLYDTAHSKAGEVSMAISCGWAAYGQYMVCDHTITGSSGKRDDLSVFTYNEADSSYKFIGLDRTGEPRVTPLTVAGKIWTYDTHTEQNGKKVHIKTINDFSKPGVIIWNTKFSEDDGAHWTLMNEGVDQKEP